jgi:hypothetical protein
MTPKINKREKVNGNDDAPVEESLLIKQRLRNLIELAVAIGQKEGLIGNHKENISVNKEGGQNVTNKGNIRDRKAAQVGQDKAGNQEEE